MNLKTFKECCGDVAVKYGLGKTLVTGHKASYWTEASENYADQFKNLLMHLAPKGHDGEVTLEVRNAFNT